MKKRARGTRILVETSVRRFRTRSVFSSASLIDGLYNSMGIVYLATMFRFDTRYYINEAGKIEGSREIVRVGSVRKWEIVAHTSKGQFGPRDRLRSSVVQAYPLKYSLIIFYASLFSFIPFLASSPYLKQINMIVQQLAY